jgi:sigma-B regulation protein RsbU (phosphoserine phosphatase)
MGGMFVTLFYALLDPATGAMTYVNAGHNPPLLRKGDASGPESLIALTRTGMALGVIEDTPFEQRTVQIAPGDAVFLYTDGVTDAVGIDGQEYGIVRLLRLLDEESRAPAGQLLDAIERALHRYVGETSQADDVTIVALSRESG